MAYFIPISRRETNGRIAWIGMETIWHGPSERWGRDTISLSKSLTCTCTRICTHRHIHISVHVNIYVYTQKYIWGNMHGSHGSMHMKKKYPVILFTHHNLRVMEINVKIGYSYHFISLSTAFLDASY